MRLSADCDTADTGDSHTPRFEPILLHRNEIAAGPLPDVQEAVRQAAGHAHRYPDRHSDAVVASLSTRLVTEPARIVVGAGSTDLLAQLLRTLCGREQEVLYASPAFEAYAALIQQAGARPATVPLTDSRPDSEAMLQAITPATRVAIVCHPHNPTGTVWTRRELEHFLDAVPSHVLVVLDEAYREFVTHADVADGIDIARRRDNVVVLRTFSKAYGLASLRIGYLVGPAAVSAALRRTAVPYTVNALAQVAATTSLGQQRALRQRCMHIARERDRVRHALRDAGFKTPHSHGNFLWLPLPGQRAEEFTAHCAAHGVAVRSYPRTGVRISLGTDAQNDIVVHIANMAP